MGIKKLNSYLQQLNLIIELNDIEAVVTYIKSLNTQNKEYIFVTIDTSLYLYKYIRTEKLNPSISFISLFKKQIIKLLKHKIIPIYIFDGVPDNLKSDTMCKRLEKKNNNILKLNNLSDIDICTLSDIDKKILDDKIIKLSIQSTYVTQKDIITLQKYFDSIKISYIISPCESDVLCAKLVQSGYADACLSEDMDILIYGCNILIKTYYGKYFIYNYDNIIKKINITSNQLCKFATLLGSDYSRCANPKIFANDLLDICKKYDFNVNLILNNIINIDIHRKFYNNDTISLSLSELSESVFSDIKTNDSELLQKIYKYYDLAYELLNFYNNNNIIDMLGNINVFNKNSKQCTVELYNNLFNNIFHNTI